MSMVRLVGFDHCVAGISYSAGEPDRLCYDTAKIYKHLMDQDQMTFSEAVEFFEYNILGSYMGETSPSFLTFADMQEILEVHCFD